MARQSEKTGVMMRRLSTSAMPNTTALGGVCWMPSAFRTIRSVTAILVKAVAITAMKGMNPVTASATKIWTSCGVKLMR